MLEDTPTLDIGSQRQMVALLAELERRQAYGGWRNWFIPDSPYSIDVLPKHKAFFDATKKYREILAASGNRCGKTISGAYFTACSLTGEYPDWWDGRVFDKNIYAWACAETAQKTRATVQKELLGEPGKLGTGLIPKDKIVKVWAKPGSVANAVDLVEVKHVCGKNSLLGFKDYSQKIKAFYGEAPHLVWCDEEPDESIYNEILMRLMTTQGLVVTTATPLHGPTPFIVNFMKNADFLAGTEPLIPLSDQDLEERQGRKNSAAVIQWGWDHCPWLDTDTKAEILERCPEHLRETRSNGRLAIGSGNVYPYPIEKMLVEPFVIPESWPRLYGFDPKFNGTAAIFGTIDPNTDTLYIYDEYYEEKQPPSYIADRLKKKTDGWIPGIVDSASKQGSKIDGQQLFVLYRDLGLNLVLADNRAGSVKTGIEAVRERIVTGRMKIFNTLRHFREEYVLYRYDEKRPNEVIKERDDMMDAWRYLVTWSRIAKPRTEKDPYTGGDDGAGRSYW